MLGVHRIGDETCTGTSEACPADAVAPPTTECRPSAGSCDPAELCDGGAKACPTDLLARVGDPGSPTQCDGTATDCPADASAVDGTTCDDGDTCTDGDVLGLFRGGARDAFSISNVPAEPKPRALLACWETSPPQRRPNRLQARCQTPRR